jgi:hypothetical protein
VRDFELPPPCQVPGLPKFDRFSHFSDLTLLIMRRGALYSVEHEI